MSDFRILYGLDDDNEGFISQQVQTASVRVRGVDDPREQEALFTKHKQTVTTFCTFCDNQHRLAGRGHSHFRMRRDGAELQYVNNSGQPVVFIEPSVPKPGEPDNVVMQDDLRAAQEVRADLHGSVLIAVFTSENSVTITAGGVAHTFPPFYSAYLYTEPEPTEDEPLDNGQIPQHVLDEAGWVSGTSIGEIVKLPGKPRLVAFALGYIEYEDADDTGFFPDARWATPLQMVSYPYPVPMFAFDLQITADRDYFERDVYVNVPNYTDDLEPVDNPRPPQRRANDPNSAFLIDYDLPVYHRKVYTADIQADVFFYTQAIPDPRQMMIGSLADVFRDNPIVMTSSTFIDLQADDLLNNMYRYDWGDPFGNVDVIPDSPRAHDVDLASFNTFGAGYKIYRWSQVSGNRPYRQSRCRLDARAFGNPLDPRLVAPLQFTGSRAAVERGYALPGETFTILPPPEPETPAVSSSVRVAIGGTEQPGQSEGSWPLYAYESTDYVVADSADRPIRFISDGVLAEYEQEELIPSDKTPFFDFPATTYTQDLALNMTVSSLPSAGDRYTADGVSFTILNRGVEWLGSGVLRDQ